MKSKTVKMISAVGVLVVLCGAYAGVKSFVSSQEEKEAEEADQSVSVTDISSDDISSVSFLSEDGEKVVLEKEDDSWVKKDQTDFPLDQDTVSSAVNGIAALTADQKVEGAGDLSEYDLDEPENEITLTTEDGEETTVQVGMKNDSSSQYYIKKSGDDQDIYLVSSSSIDPFMDSVYDFAQAETFPAVTSSTITDVQVEKENGYELSRDSETLGWDVSDGKETDKADTTKAGNITSAIGSLSYEDFVDYNCTDDSRYGFDDPYAVITAKYTEEEEAEEDTDTEEDTSGGSETDTEDSSSAEDSDAGEDAEETDTGEETGSAEASEDAEDEEPETVTVDKKLVIYVGDKTDDSRYVKVNDSNEVYTITEDSLTDILDSTMEDFYDLTVSYLSVNNLETLEIEAGGETHEVEVIRETSEDEDGEETTTYSYELDGQEMDETDFTTFYNKMNNMIAQERLTEDYEPENDPSYIFTMIDTDGQETLVKYYEYDTNFYAAVVDDKVYLVNKMNVRDMEEAYEEMIGNSDTDSAAENKISAKNAHPRYLPETGVLTSQIKV